MSENQSYLKSLLTNLEAIRQKAKITEQQLEEKLILGPGWISRFESGSTVPSIDMILAILHELKSNLSDLLEGLPEPDPAEVERVIFAEQKGKDLVINFRYADYDAHYILNNGTLEEYEEVVKTLRNGLSRLVKKGIQGDEVKQIKTEAVANMFLAAVKKWPNANPSDLWWFLVYRAYCDPYNHPSKYARLDFTQSWKRTGGWALEEILVRHYAPFLHTHGISIYIADSASKNSIVENLRLKDRLEADKIDVVLSGDTPKGKRFFGVVHVKASFAERRTDDVPMSIALINAGFTSPLWTMDCKSMPSALPKNRGELGHATEGRSAKRKDIEDEGYFSGCFSYNKNTKPSPKEIAADRRVSVCDFSNPDDKFSKFIIERWKAFQAD